MFNRAGSKSSSSCPKLSGRPSHEMEREEGHRPVSRIHGHLLDVLCLQAMEAFAVLEKLALDFATQASARCPEA